MTKIQRDFTRATHVNPEYFLASILNFLRVYEDTELGSSTSMTWFVNSNGDKIGQMDIKYDSITIYRIP